MNFTYIDNNSGFIYTKLTKDLPEGLGEYMTPFEVFVDTVERVDHRIVYFPIRELDGGTFPPHQLKAMVTGQREGVLSLVFLEAGDSTDALQAGTVLVIEKFQ